MALRSKFSVQLGSTIRPGASSGVLSPERRHVDHEAVLHVATLYALVGLVDLADVEQFDVVDSDEILVMLEGGSLSAAPTGN